MDNIEKQVQPIVAELMGQDENDPQFVRPGSMGVTDDAREVWQKFIERVNKDAYDLICTKEVRLAELRAFFQNAPERFAAVLVGILVAESLVPAALATVVGAILAKLILRNAQGALCDVWATKLF
jgi:hypothetical protein